MGNEVSCASIMVISELVANFISAWNSHRISGRNGGIPNVLARGASEATQLNPIDVPLTNEAVASYKESSGNRLTRVSWFGRDPK